MEALIIAIISAFIVRFLIRQLRSKIPPGPKPWPVTGNLNGLKPIPLKSFKDWANKYGPIISVWSGPNLNVVISNSEMAKQVLKEHDQVLANRCRGRAQDILSGHGLDLMWADYGLHYIKLRKMCDLELFSGKKLEDLRDIREDEVAAMIHSIHKQCTYNFENKTGSSLVLRKYLEEVALNTITRLVLGKRFVDSKGKLDEQGQEFKTIVADGRRLLKESMTTEFIPLLRWFSPSHDHEVTKHKARIDEFTKQIMEEHTKASQESGASKQHFVDALLSVKDHYELTNETIVGLLWNLINAGMDTTTIVVEWALAELIKSPRILRKVQEELDQVVGLERVMTEDDIPSLPYLQAIVKEALRLHPPTPLMLPHRAKVHVKVGEYDIPKGTTVHVNVWAIGRDPENWSNPIQFRPERFFESDVHLKGTDFRLLPFGAGRRVCIGTQLGLKLVTLMLGRLVHHFNWCPPEGINHEEIDFLEDDSVFVSYMATPLRAEPILRLPSQLYKK